MGNGVREYRVGLVISYVVVASVISLLIQGMYREFVDVFIRLMFTRDYSYLLVVSSTIVVIMYLLLKHISFTYEVQLSRIVVSVLLVVTAITLYHISRINLEYSFQILSLSFFTAVTSLMLIILKFTSLGDVVLLTIPLLLIPIPADLLDVITLTLSRTIGKLAVLLTSAELIESSSLTLVRVVSRDETQVFSVESICSGVIMLSSIIAILPLLAYYVKAVYEKILRKLVVSLLTILTGLIVGFLGNLMRVVLVVFIAKYYGVNLTLTVLQYLPSAVYAVTSVFIAYMMITKLTRVRGVVPGSSVSRVSSSELRWERIIGVLILVVMTALILQSLAVTIDSRQSLLTNGLVIRVDRLEDLIKNPLKCLSSRVIILNSTYDEFLTRVTDSLVTHRVSVLVDNVNYIGFLDITDMLVRLHTLRLYVTLQGYNVVSLWSKEEEGFQITYILMEGDYGRYLLAYTILPIAAITPSSEYVLYVRLSLMKQYVSIEDLNRLSNALLMTLNTSLVKPLITGNSLSVLNITYVMLLAILVIYISVVYLYNVVLRRKR